MPNCPSCASKETQQFYSSDIVPVDSGAVFDTQADAVAMPVGRMCLAICQGCGYIWNTAFEPGLISYGTRYDISMHHSPTYQAFLEETARRLIETYHVNNQSVLEIACGSGHFLRLLCRLGPNTGTGIDPSSHSEGTQKCGAGVVNFIRDLYGDKYAHLPANLVCCRHVIEALPDPKQFLRTVCRILQRQANVTVYFETQNADYMYTGPIKWSFMYEFSAQLNPTSLSRLFAESGFRVLNAGPCYEDGQYAFIEAVPDGNPRSEHPERFLASGEFLRRVEAFSKKVNEAARHWRATMAELRKSGKTVVGWGAGGRAGVFFSMFDVDRIIKYVVDINPLRQRKFMSVTGKEIVAPQFLQEYRPDVVMVTNRTYTQEIARQIKEMGLASTIIEI